MTVEENLDMGAYLRRDSAGIAGDRDRVLTQFPRLAERRSQVAGTLSGGEQQMLAIGRAIMSRPKLMMFDEPSLGLAPNIVEQVFEIIEGIRQSGTTVLMVEQNAYAALDMCDYAYLMEAGSIVLSGPRQRTDRQQAHQGRVSRRIGTAENGLDAVLAPVAASTFSKLGLHSVALKYGLARRAQFCAILLQALLHRAIVAQVLATEP